MVMIAHRGQAVQIEGRQLPQARELIVLDAGGVEFIRLRLGQSHGDVIEQKPGAPAYRAAAASGILRSNFTARQAGRGSG
jgi:hypothetical protein